MDAERSYLDWNATAPVRTEAAEAMARALLIIGNPSSIHAEGRAARALVEEARSDVAALVGASPRRVVFTSGGSEANAYALSPSLGLGDGRIAGVLLHGATEHACVIEGHRFPKEAARTVPVDADGLVRLDALAEGLAGRRDGRALVSIQLANNETGVIQPIAEIALMCRQADALLHVDAVQAAGKIAIDMSTLGADVLTLSAHKLGGPKGVGAVVFGSDRVEVRDRLIGGGGQERGARAGTENVPGIAGFGAAARAARVEIDASTDHCSRMRDAVEAGVLTLAPDTAVFGARAPRLPNTTCFATPGVSAENALILLDLAGVSASSGSACSSGKVRASHVLAAMGVDPSLARGALRLSVGRTTSMADVDRFLAAYGRALAASSGRKAAIAA